MIRNFYYFKFKKQLQTTVLSKKSVPYIVRYFLFLISNIFITHVSQLVFFFFLQILNRFGFYSIIVNVKFRYFNVRCTESTVKRQGNYAFNIINIMKQTRFFKEFYKLMLFLLIVYQ